MNNQTIHQQLGKPVSSFSLTVDWILSDQFFYTTELSRILLVGEPSVFETVRGIPFINVPISSSLFIFNVLFNNRFVDGRFEKFIKNSEKYSQAQLQEAIEDAVVLTTYNTNAYSVSRLLDYLSEALQDKVGYIKEQVNYDSKWDHRSFRALKKWGALAAGFTVFVVVMNKYIVDNNVERIEGLTAIATSIATLGLLPALYQVLKNCYKLLTTNPNANHETLGKYEELLLFVQKLKEQLKTSGFITLTLCNGSTATIANDTFNTVEFS